MHTKGTNFQALGRILRGGLPFKDDARLFDFFFFFAPQTTHSSSAVNAKLG